MCNFVSALVMSNGDLFYNENLKSHEDLIDFFNIKDSQFNLGKFIRIEFKPDNNEDYIDISKYKLIVDEKSIPEWFTDDMKEQIIERLKSKIEKQIILTDRKLLTGGIYIIGKGVTVDKVINATVEYNFGTVTYNYGTVTYNYDTVTHNNGTVTYNYGTVTDNIGIVTNNNGIVTNNNNTVTNNKGTVSYNNGTVTNNYGTVTNNNNGTVTYNSGTVTHNYGTVTNNYGTVTYNSGTVSKNEGMK